MSKIIAFSALLCISFYSSSQYTIGNGICELPTFHDWSTGAGANPCACTWYEPKSGYVLCSYGNCGSDELNECAADCALFVSGTGYTNGRWWQGGGNYGFQVCGMVLNVDLISFTGRSQGKDIELKWETINEIDVKNFNILYSKDGTDFELLTAINSAGGERLTTYHFIHNNVSKGTHYYKLEEVDANDQTVELSVIKVENEGVDANELFSSPFYNKETKELRMFYFGKDANEKVELSIVSMDGTFQMKKETRIENNKLSFNLGDVASGMYFIQVTHKGKTELKKIVV